MGSDREKPGWPHSDTIILIDCLDAQKRGGTWTQQQRDEVVGHVRRDLEAKGRPVRSAKIIHRRIATIGDRWHTKSYSLALFHYGWDGLHGNATREALLADPDSTMLRRRSKHEWTSTPAEQPPKRLKRKQYRATSGEYSCPHSALCQHTEMLKNCGHC